MSSGSYFTLYRKNEKAKVGQDVIKALEEEYYKSNKDGLFNNKDDNALRADIPMLMCSSFTASDDIGEKNANGSKFVFYDKDGIRYDKLLEFSFCSTFSGLKKKLDLDPYSYKRASKIISKDEAKKILQAIEYVLSGNYSKKFESILRNEYIEALGNGYSPFDKRFNKVPNSVYIDKDGDGYIEGSSKGKVAVKYIDFNNPGFDYQNNEIKCEKDYSFRCHKELKDNAINSYIINDIAVNPEYGTICTAVGNGLYKIWDIEKRSWLYDRKNFTDKTPLTACEYNLNGDLLAYASGYDWSKGAQVAHLYSKPKIFLHYLQPEHRKKIEL